MTEPIVTRDIIVCDAKMFYHLLRRMEACGGWRLATQLAYKADPAAGTEEWLVETDSCIVSFVGTKNEQGDMDYAAVVFPIPLLGSLWRTRRIAKTLFRTDVETKKRKYLRSGPVSTEIICKGLGVLMPAVFPIGNEYIVAAKSLVSADAKDPCWYDVRVVANMAEADAFLAEFQDRVDTAWKAAAKEPYFLKKGSVFI